MHERKIGGPLSLAALLLSSFCPALVPVAAAQGTPSVQSQEPTTPRGVFPDDFEAPAPEDAPAAVAPTPAQPSAQGEPPGATASAQPATTTVPDPNWTEILKAVSPAVAKVGCGDSWHSGFAIRPDLVVTTLAAVSHYCEAEARVGNDDPIAIEVVAWSTEDRVVIVRLAKPVSAPPLRFHPPQHRHQIGEEVAVLGSDVNYALPTEDWGRWQAPRARLARAGAVTPALALDRDLDSRSAGAPVLSATGEVIGMLQAGAPPVVVPSSVVNALADTAGQQGSFSLPWDLGMIGGVMVSIRPNQPGVFAPIGARFDWLALQAGLGFWLGGTTPVSGDRLEQGKFAAGLEVEANARYRFERHGYLLAGLGVQGLARTQDVWTTGEEEPEHKRDRSGSVFVSFASGAGAFQTRCVVGLTEPELRVDVGVVTGRY